jgi:hypothetical protein
MLNRMESNEMLLYEKQEGRSGLWYLRFAILRYVMLHKFRKNETVFLEGVSKVDCNLMCISFI